MARFVADFAALAFGLHPLRVEAVALAAARADLLCGLFVMLSVLSRLHGSAYESGDRGRSRWLGASFGCYALTLFASIKGLALPFVWFLLDRYRMTVLSDGAKGRRDPQLAPNLKQPMAWFGIGLVTVGFPPDDAKIYSKLGEVLAAQGKLDAAIDAFRTVVALQPAEAEFQENLGRALNERGFREEGAKHLREALRILRSTPAAR